MKFNASKGCLLAVMGFMAVALPSGAQVTFGAGNVDHLATAGAQQEAGYSYVATGDGWEIQDVFGNPPSALTTFFNSESSNTGDTVVFTKVGGGSFLFTSLDTRTIIDHNSDQAVIEGFLSGNPVGSINLTTSSTTFQTVAGFGGPIDTLRIRVSAGIDASTTNARLFDNFVFGSSSQAVPEPGSLALLSGLLVPAGILFRRLRA